MFERFTEKAIKVIMLAQEESRQLGNNYVGTEKILLGLIGEGTGIAAKTLKSLGVSLKDARTEVEKIIGRESGFVAVEIPFTPRAKRVLDLSWDEARQLGHNYIGTEHLLLGLIREGEGVAVRVLENLDVDLSRIRSNVIRRLGESVAAANNPSAPKGFIIDLTAQAAAGGIAPLNGREAELARLMRVLGKAAKNNPLLIGPAGVGKRSIVDELARRIKGDEAPMVLRDMRVVVLRTGDILLNTKLWWEFAEALQDSLARVQEAGRALVVVENLHRMINDFWGMRVDRVLENLLAVGKLQFLFAMSEEAVQRCRLMETGIGTHLTPIQIAPLGAAAAKALLATQRLAVITRHGFEIPEETLDEALRLAARYLPGQPLAVAARDLLDEAASALAQGVEARPEPTLIGADLRPILAQMAGVLEEELVDE